MALIGAITSFNGTRAVAANNQIVQLSKV